MTEILLDRRKGAEGEAAPASASPINFGPPAKKQASSGFFSRVSEMIWGGEEEKKKEKEKEKEPPRQTAGENNKRRKKNRRGKGEEGKDEEKDEEREVSRQLETNFFSLKTDNLDAPPDFFTGGYFFPFFPSLPSFVLIQFFF